MYERWNGSPCDRGSADRYYMRGRNPHKYPNGTYNGPAVTDLTPEEIEAYNYGYDNETDCKDYGQEGWDETYIQLY